MLHQRGEKDGHRDELCREDGLRDEVCVIDQAGCAARNRFLKQQERQISTSEEHYIVVSHLARRDFAVQADLKDEHPAQQQHQWLYEAPEPSGGRPDEPLLEITAHQLHQKMSFSDEITNKMAAGD